MAHLRQVAPHLPAALAQAVERGLSRDPAQRYPTCTAFAEAVLQALGGGAAPGRAVPAHAPAAKGPPRLPPPVRGPATPPPVPRSAAPTRRQGPTGQPAFAGGRGALLVAAVILSVGAVVGGVFAYRALRGRPAGTAAGSAAAGEAFRFRSPEAVSIQPGQAKMVTIRIVRLKYEGPVRLECAQPLPGVSVSEGTIGPGQSEGKLRVEVADRAAGLLEVPLQGVVDGVKQPVVLPLRVLPPPELKVELPTTLPRLRPGGDSVTVRVRVVRQGCADQEARYEVEKEDAPVEVSLSKGTIPAGQDRFEFYVKPNADTPNKPISLPITVRVPSRNLQQRVVLQLSVEK
jgi:hypothetical protein